MRGFFITLEGGEACGKTTQAELLGGTLRSETKREVVVSRSPGGVPVAEKIRNILKEKTDGFPLVPEAELLLFAACHAQMTQELIRPAMERGAIIISDRFIDSTLVYQGYARGLNLENIRWLNRYSTKMLLPDLTIVLDIPVSCSLRRLNSRDASCQKRDRFDSESVEFFQKIRDGFLTCAADNSERIAVVDASGDIQTVHQLILEKVYEKLGSI